MNRTLSLLALLLLASSPVHAVGLSPGEWGRPYHLHIPAVRPAGGLPLLIMLHGYQTTSTQQDMYLDIKQEADRRHWIYAYLDGTRDPAGNQYWNGAGCCQVLTAPTDWIEDVEYIDAVLTQIIEYVAANTTNTVDTRRIYLLGHSSGGFMAHRYASERGWRVAAIVSLAGSIWNLRPPFATAPANRVSVLQIHATNDTLIPFYDGYSITTFLGYFFFGAYHTIDVWAYRNGCTHPPFQGFLPASGDRFNLVAPSVAHPDLYETTRLPAFGCPPSIGVELWKIDGSFLTTFNLQGHAPAFNGGVFATETLNWLQAHSKAL